MENESTKRDSLIKLIIWLFVIAALVGFNYLASRSSNSNNVTNNTNTFSNTASIPSDNTQEGKSYSTFEEMQQGLLLGKYSYNYVITSNDITYKYYGNTCNGEYLGYKETSNEIIKYYIKDNKTYKVVLNKIEETDNLYEGIDSSFLDMETLWGNLSNYLYIIEDGVIKYNKDGYQASVTIKDNIMNLKIENIDATYNLEFSNIGYCAKIDIGL